MDRKELRKQVTKSVTTETRDEIKKVWRRLGLIVLVLFGFLTLGIMQRGLATRTEPPAEPFRKEVEMADLQVKAIDSARGFLEAETIPEKAAYVWDPRRVQPLMEKYYQTHAIETRKFKDMVFEVTNSFHVANDREFVWGTVIFDDGSDEMWIFEKDSKGDVKLQWEVAVIYSDKDWETFLDTKDTESGTFRVLLKPLFDNHSFDYDLPVQRDDVEPSMTDKDNRGYFNRDFPDPNEHACFSIRIPGSERSVYGYLAKSSDPLKSFVAVRRISNLTELPTIVTLRFPEDAHGEQVHIDDIQCFSWVAGVDM